MTQDLSHLYSFKALIYFLKMLGLWELEFLTTLLASALSSSATLRISFRHVSLIAVIYSPLGEYMGTTEKLGPWVRRDSCALVRGCWISSWPPTCYGYCWCCACCLWTGCNKTEAWVTLCIHGANVTYLYMSPFATHKVLWCYLLFLHIHPMTASHPLW